MGYVGAATVEYLYSVKDKKYYFLELNPRLQVEHPVTEGITNVNLPACQVMVGMGIPLHRIPDIRSLFLQNPEETNSIDFETSLRKEPQGHVIAVRITSENANDGFKPTSGNIDELHFRSTADVWGYFSVKSRGGIHEFSDSQFGHLFAKGKSRQESIRSMILALKEIQIRGEIRTTVDYIIDMIQESDFVDQHIHTAWLDQRIAQQVLFFVFCFRILCADHVKKTALDFGFGFWRRRQSDAKFRIEIDGIYRGIEERPSSVRNASFDICGRGSGFGSNEIPRFDSETISTSISDCTERFVL